jgi:hypothetical protein
MHISFEFRFLFYSAPCQVCFIHGFIYVENKIDKFQIIFEFSVCCACTNIKYIESKSYQQHVLIRSSIMISIVITAVQNYVNAIVSARANKHNSQFMNASSENDAYNRKNMSLYQ